MKTTAIAKGLDEIFDNSLVGPLYNFELTNLTPGSTVLFIPEHDFILYSYGVICIIHGAAVLYSLSIDGVDDYAKRLFIGKGARVQYICALINNTVIL